MKPCVVDTNVAVIANCPPNSHASLQCQLACVEELEALYSKGVVAIDDLGLIFEEYKKRLSFAGEPGMGDAFFKFVADNQYSTSRVKRVSISPNQSRKTGFDELPVNGLDYDDRCFLATAVSAKGFIVNATDSDWAQNTDLTNSLNIKVKQLCPDEACKPKSKLRKK